METFGSGINIPFPQTGKNKNTPKMLNSELFLFKCTDANRCWGSGSFYHQAKIVRKTMIPTVL
jgi:hypothetical protein